MQQTGAGVLATLAARAQGVASLDQPSDQVVLIPPHREIPLPGFHAYAAGQSVVAGKSLDFHVSSTVPYDFSIVKLGTSADDPETDEVVHRFASLPAAPQPIHAGSYIHIANALTREQVPAALAMECWVRLFKTDALQGMITQGDVETSGIGLSLSATGEIVFQGTARVIGPKLLKHRWYHLVGQWDGTENTLWVDGQRVAATAAPGLLAFPPSPLRLGASERQGRADVFLDGDLAMPVLYAKALSLGDIQRRFSEKGMQAAAGKDTLACWPLDEEVGDAVADVTANKRQGRIINHGTWMIGGPGFDGKKVPRYGVDYDPAKDVSRGHGLRLASDDLYDCRWKVTHSFAVPENAESGIYCGRARFELNGKAMLYHVTFIVRRAANKAKAPILVLCSSNTWLSYNSTPFAVNQRWNHSWGTYGCENSHPLAPAYSNYRGHHAGQPCFQQGLRMPWPAAGPDVLYSSKATGYSHLMRAERFAHIWLKQNGYDFDVITDLDLHRDPGQLIGYRALMINGHSEYWSREAYQGVDDYLKQGGNAVVFSGNTMFWRVSFNSEGTVMECRKFDERIGGQEGAPIGEIFHSDDRRRGSLMRECGLPAWQVLGLECDGWGGIENKELGVYHPETPDHFLFKQPESVALAQGETFGHGPGGAVPRAVGHEWDVRLGRLKALTKNLPAGATLPDEPEGIVTLARGVREQKDALDYFTNPVKSPDGTVAEMIYWERPQGGRVFHAGAIAAGWVLSVDPKMQALVRNVLHHFGVTKRR